MHENPIMKYSVLASVYNLEKAANLEEALLSMVNQTIRPDEIVLVEDGPLTPELHRKIDELKDNYKGLFKILTNESNMGLGKSLQRGLIECKNQFVARMDTDDIARPDRCELQIKYLQQHPSVAVVGGQIAEFVDCVENCTGIRNVPLTSSQIANYLKKRCPMNHVTVMFRKDQVLEAGNYQPWFCNEDYYLWIRMQLKGMKFGNLSQVLCDVRISNDYYKRRGGKSYFQSEKKLQDLMLKEKIISIPRYSINVIERAIIQVMIPNWLRGFLFKTVARNNPKRS